MRKILTDKIRKFLFAMIPVIFLGSNSVYLIIENRPEDLSKFGAIIIAWAIFNISRKRNVYSNSLAQWEKTILYKYIEFYREKDELQEDRLNTTLNLHACQIAQLSSHLGVPNPFIENDKKSIEQFCNQVAADLANEKDFQLKHTAIQEKINKFVDDYKENTAPMQSWEKLLWNIEVGLLIWGTLQNAYGADFVRLLQPLL